MDLTSEQIKTVFAAFLGWMLDAFDFFLLTFLLKDIAKEFGVEISSVAYALFLTLAMRFVGASSAPVMIAHALATTAARRSASLGPPGRHRLQAR
jgi:hypothetical protein